MNPAIDALKDDVLLSLFSSRLDYSTAYAASEIVRDALHTALQQSTVSKLFGGRTVLNDWYPIVGRVGALYTKQLVGYNYENNNGKKVTVPTFNIVCCPAWKRMSQPRPEEVRKTLNDSIAAIDESEVGYVQGLLDCIADYNQNYPLIHCKLEDINTEFVLWVTSRMQQLKVTPKALFANSALYDELAPVALDLGLELIMRSDWKVQAIDIFGLSADPELTTCHLMDNRMTLKIRDDDGYKDLRQVENVGFLMSQASSIRIHIDGDTPEPSPRWSQPPVTAYVVGEEGGDSISIVK